MSSLQSGEKNYIKLFDSIEKQNEYNEDAIKHQFREETFIKHLPSEKNQPIQTHSQKSTIILF